MTDVIFAVGALLLITGAVVAASLLIESGGRVRVPVGEGPAGDAGQPDAAEQAEPVEPLNGSSFEQVDVSEPVHLVVEGEGAREQLVAALLATYAAARLPEANRVAAWVTSAGWPPGRKGSAYRPGVNLRGRPAAVQQLLECDVEQRCWVTLNDNVDVDRGLRIRPASCDVLRGVCTLRRVLVEGEPLADADLELAGAALETLGPVWQGTTVAVALDELADAVRDAAQQSSQVVVSQVVPMASVDELPPRTSTGADRDERVAATA